MLLPAGWGQQRSAGGGGIRASYSNWGPDEVASAATAVLPAVRPSRCACASPDFPVQPIVCTLQRLSDRQAGGALASAPAAVLLRLTCLRSQHSHTCCRS